MQYDKLSYQINGICLKIYRKLGTGLQEKIYNRAIQLELKRRKFKFISEYQIPIYYEKELICQRRADFFIENKILLEIKAVKKLKKEHFRQIFNYIEISNISFALLINFGEHPLNIQRIHNKKFRC